MKAGVQRRAPSDYSYLQLITADKARMFYHLLYPRYSKLQLLTGEICKKGLGKQTDSGGAADSPARDYSCLQLSNRRSMQKGPRATDSLRRSSVSQQTATGSLTRWTHADCLIGNTGSYRQLQASRLAPAMALIIVKPAAPLDRLLVVRCRAPFIAYRLCVILMGFVV